VTVAWTNDLLTGIAQHLENQSLGNWDPNGVSAEVAIVIGPMPPTPNRVIAIEDYTPNGKNQATDVTRLIQVRCRGAANNPASVRDLRDAVEDALDGLAWVDLGGVAVQQIFLGPRALLGVDGNNRTETTSNFTIQARRTTGLRTE
jgi:hypothetical protein